MCGCGEGGGNRDALRRALRLHPPTRNPHDSRAARGARGEGACAARDTAQAAGRVWGGAPGGLVRCIKGEEGKWGKKEFKRIGGRGPVCVWGGEV